MYYIIIILFFSLIHFNVNFEDLNLGSHRESAEEQLGGIVTDVQELHDALEIDLQLPRIVKRQQHRTNTPADSLIKC